ELAEYIHTPSWNRPIVYYDDDDDDDEDYTIAITPVLPTEEPKDSLITRDKHLNTIPEKESGKFTKSSVENLVPRPSEPDDISDDECDLPLYNDFPKILLVTFSNPLLNIDNDFTSSDDESFFEEDVLMENFKFFSNPLFDLDKEIISTEIDSLLDEFAGELIFLKSIPQEIDEADFDPKGDISLIEKLLYVENSIESFPHLISSLRIATLL
nr:hypothetical protein [Tanacetum cinerariifolium]GEU88891.1 hypothetical protein [Tanacetum cinerariifolium]